jgi:hypothetical protein
MFVLNNNFIARQGIPADRDRLDIESGRYEDGASHGFAVDQRDSHAWLRRVAEAIEQEAVLILFLRRRGRRQKLVI